MKKKILMTLAVVLLVAISVVSLVACTSKKPIDFLDKLATAENFSITMEMTQDATITIETIYDKGNLSYTTKDATGKLITGGYFIKNGDEEKSYTFIDGIGWKKAELSGDSPEYKAALESLKKVKMAKDNITKDGETIVEKKDAKGQWILQDKDGKEDGEMYFICDGKALTAFVKNGETYVKSLVITLKGTVTLPAEVTK